MPKDDVGYTIKLSETAKAFAELCKVHAQIMELVKREAILMDQIKIACMTAEE